MLAVAATTPAAGALDVSRTAAITATLNAPISAASATDGSVTLAGALGAVDATVSVEGSTLRLQPRAGSLVADARYTLTLPASLQDTAGRSLGTAVSLQFTTAAMAWAPRATALASVAELNAVQAQVAALDRSGRLLLAWTDGVNGPVLKTSRAGTTDGTWTAAATVSNPGDSARSPNLSCLPSGPCQLAWIQSPSLGRATLQLSRFDAASGSWSAPAAVPMPVGDWDLSWISSATGADSRLTLLGWAGDRVIALRQAADGTGWETPVTRVIVPSGARTARLAMDRAGNLTAVWIELGTFSERLMGSHYDAASGTWSADEQLDDRVNPGEGIDMVVDASGSVTAAYLQGGFESRARAVRWQSQLARWSGFTTLDPATSGLDGTPKLAIDAAGNVTAVWAAWPGARAARWEASTGSWSAPEPLPAGMGSFGTRLTADPAGNVTAVSSTSFAITVTRWLTKDRAWTPLTEIGTPPTGTALFASRVQATAVNKDGSVGVTWTQTNDVGGSRATAQFVNVLR